MRCRAVLKMFQNNSSLIKRAIMKTKYECTYRNGQFRVSMLVLKNSVNGKWIPSFGIRCQIKKKEKKKERNPGH